MMKKRHYLLILLTGVGFSLQAQHTKYPMERPERTIPTAAEGVYDIYPQQLKQVVKGVGVEIYSDQLNNNSDGMNMKEKGMLHDITPDERERLYKEMLTGFRYARLAGGLYLRGMDAEKKQLRGRWPSQMTELKEMVRGSGMEGVSFEYFSPLPYWKANQKLTGKDGSDNVLRCFGKDFKNDPVYKGDTTRFLNDFAEAVVNDIQFLKNNGLPISFFGLQNEPMSDTRYSSCVYKNLPIDKYGMAYVAVAKKIREMDPDIRIIGDSQGLRLIRPVVANSETSDLVDYMVMHHGGVDSKQVQPIEPYHGKALFQNEYSYSGGGVASPARCINTVQHIMNWFQRREAPSWFWLHAMMPYDMKMSSGRALGLYRPKYDTDDSKYPEDLKPGHWVWNPHNWHALASFIKHMPWDSQVVGVKERDVDEDLRILAFKKPNGKLVIMLSNRSFGTHRFVLQTRTDAVYKGYRYTADEAGTDFMGVELGALSGKTIRPEVPDMAWEFWEEQ
ncbi:hypothetical protein FXV77_12070 [Sphingobacterium phlebotomi]|uniref:O-glycosyl hydrolase n=1 Tax=Sphingobacterium phlebotomi TaxID=2605433 RepID=A0A5D4H562_9SPHI|nr:hypothetical protein [Sphingobacterium phlebotomi]TYR35808.1 hypothetical protein FXV77_12070 [Sphingobacterium phlebotomi]